MPSIIDAIENNAQIGGWTLDVSNSSLTWTQGTRTIHEVPDNYVPQLDTAISFYAEPFDGVIAQAVEEASNSGTSFNIKARIRTYTGSMKWVNAIGMRNKDSEGKVTIYGTFQDITAQHDTLLNERRETNYHSIVLNSVLEALITTNEAGIICSFNKAATDMFGFTTDEAIGMPIENFMPQPHRDRHHKYVSDYTSTGVSNIIGSSGRVLEAVKKDGSTFPINLRIHPVKLETGAGFVGTIRDLTSENKAAEKLKWLLLYDDVTGLPNRLYLLNYLDKINISTQLTLAVLDIDYFSRINLAHGQDVGDSILRGISKRISSFTGEHTLTGRDLNDRFWVVLHEDTQPSQSPKIIIDDLIQVLNRPFLIGSRKHHLNFSVGVSCSDEKQSSSQLISNTEAALFAAKNNGRNQIFFYEKNSSIHLLSDYKIETSLREAIENSRLETWIQPKFDSKQNLCSGEVLTRWTLDNGDMVSPDKFIPIAEKSGLIHGLGSIVAKNTAEMLRSINAEFPEFTLAMNVSPKEFINNDFCEKIKTTFDAEGANLNNLIIEITENLLVDDKHHIVEIMNGLTAYGITISIDDFGTGYSNLKRIMELPVTEIKIDKGFILDIERSPRNAALVSAIINMAKSLQYKVVAEGVENQYIADWCINNKVEYLQGYHYAKPMPFKQFMEAYT